MLLQFPSFFRKCYFFFGTFGPFSLSHPLTYLLPLRVFLLRGNSTIVSYPLVFSGARDGVLDLLSVPVEKRTSSNLNKVTVTLLSLLTGLALVVKDLSFLLSLSGATIDNSLIYVYPAMIFRKAVQKMGDKATPALKRESAFSWIISSLGIFLGFIGTKMAIQQLG